MVVLDPTVFKGDPAYLGRVRTFGYVGIALGVAALAFDLCSRKRRAFIAGFLGACCVASAIVGVAILPLSLLGLLILIGVLGFSPFLTAFVFGRRSLKNFEESPIGRRRTWATLGFAAFFCIAVGAQAITSHLYHAALNHVLTGNAQQTATAVKTLKRLMQLIDSDQLIFAWKRTTDPNEKQRLETAYEQVTGQNLAGRAERLVDL